MSNKNTMGKTKRSTDDMIDNAIAQQNDWLENRRSYARRFLKTLNIFARPSEKKQETKTVVAQKKQEKKSHGILRAFWFPILCAIIVLLIAIWVMFLRTSTPQRIVIVPVVPDSVTRVMSEKDAPSFDVVRIQPDGNIVVAGRWAPNQKISIAINGKVVATEQTNGDGEFVYAPTKPLPAGNYTLSLIGVDTSTKSSDKVFLYISEHGHENSISLLMTKKGSTLLQAPTTLREGDLNVSKIDYLDNGRIVVTGDAMPRLRVSLWLNDTYMGYAHVSDYRHFGLGADIGKLESGKEYKLSVRLHDGDGTTVSSIDHTFTMPEMTGDEDTFYTVRRGDCLWIIARNFMRRGILFSIIADKNNIENPDLIFPKQKLQIPVNSK
ncbi:MAG: LysM peptidoglycan-binding domain-containing protein [Alphaproteobacteria bacterium]|nr:LysM peptidoglycan-binding domain-containing protein [Alphaproteobacteria bacterium]